MERLLNQLGEGRVVKEEIEGILKEAYYSIQNLRKMTFDRAITAQEIDMVEKLFVKNQFDPKDLQLPKYLQKYAKCINCFWNSTSYYNRQRSRGKFNLFESLKQIAQNGNSYYFENEFSIILRRMEDYWIASNQVYTKHEISLIRKEYIR